MELRVQPLTKDLWPEIEELFESGTACKRCWCMYWRIGSAYRKRPAEVNNAALSEDPSLNLAHLGIGHLYGRMNAFGSPGSS
jgi:hypothetical protein